MVNKKEWKAKAKSKAKANAKAKATEELKRQSTQKQNHEIRKIWKQTIIITSLGTRKERTETCK